MLPVIVDKKSMLPPATCFKCRGDQGSPRLYWMFMGVTLDWEGAVYYCNECLKDIVKEVPDAYTQEDVDKLILAYNDEIEEAKIQNEAATNILTRLRFLGFDTDKLLEEGDYGRNDDVSDEHHSGEQQVLDGNEQKTPEQNSSRKFRVHDFSE